MEAPEKDRAAMLKDAFLLAAAQATQDRMVVSLDDKARKLFQALAAQVPQWGTVSWINPGSDEESAISWLGSGAKPDPARRLGYRRKKKR
jgi:hypothetical protein